VPHAFPPLPLMEGEEVIETNPDQAQLTQRFTRRAVEFIEKQGDDPFFLCLAHAMPHVPIFASDEFLGSSPQGLYGDVIQEIDASTGELLIALEREGIDERTWVIFLSDNGPWLTYGNHSGKADPFRGGKLTTWEGGVRVPMLMRWPGRIPAGRRCEDMLTGMDFLPSIASALGLDLPSRKIDGIDLWPVISGTPDAENRRETFLYYQTEALHAVRHGRWKLHAPHAYVEVDGEPGRDGKPARWSGPIPLEEVKSDPVSIAARHGYRIEETGWALYDLDADPGETNNVAVQHPNVVAELQALLEEAREDLGDSIHERKGKGTREPGVHQP